MENKEYNYRQAYTRLQEISSLIESEDMNIDNLAMYISEAMDMIEICKNKLSNIESDVSALLDKLEKQNIELSE